MERNIIDYIVTTYVRAEEHQLYMAQLALRCAYSFRRNSPGTFQTTIVITRQITCCGSAAGIKLS